MYTIRLLFDVCGWAYYWRCRALQDYAPEDFEVTIGSDYGLALSKKPHDLVLQLASCYVADLRKTIERHNYNTKIVSSYNVGWGYNNNWLKPVIDNSDFVIINNYEMWDKYGRQPKTVNISNGVNTRIFNIKKDPSIRKHRVLWTGSIGHRKVKNYDTILVPLSKLLKKDNISLDFRLVNSSGSERLNQEQMCQWYNTGTIYVVASQQEGTPNPLLESSACGCVPVSTRCGNAPELIKDGINGYLCDANVQSLYEGIKKAINNYSDLTKNMQETIKTWDWSIRSKEYYDLFRKIIKEKTHKNIIQSKKPTGTIICKRQIKQLYTPRGVPFITRRK